MCLVWVNYLHNTMWSEQMWSSFHQTEQAETHCWVRFTAIASQNFQSSCEVAINPGSISTLLCLEYFCLQLICTYYILKRYHHWCCHCPWSYCIYSKIIKVGTTGQNHYFYCIYYYSIVITHLVLGRRTANFTSAKKRDSHSPEAVCNLPVLAVMTSWNF